MIFKQYSTATSGTVAIQDTKQDVQLIHNGSALAATLTITFPASPVDGQTFSLASKIGVTVLTMSGAGTILGGLTALVANSFAAYMYDTTSASWYRIG